MKVKIYVLGDCEWYAGRSWLSVFRHITGYHKLSWKEVFAQGLFLVPDEYLDQLEYHNPGNETEAEYNCTFRQELQRRIDAGQKFPQDFASENY